MKCNTCEKEIEIDERDVGLGEELICIECFNKDPSYTVFAEVDDKGKVNTVYEYIGEME